MLSLRMVSEVARGLESDTMPTPKREVSGRSYVACGSCLVRPNSLKASFSERSVNCRRGAQDFTNTAMSVKRSGLQKDVLNLYRRQVGHRMLCFT